VFLVSGVIVMVTVAGQGLYGGWGRVYKSAFLPLCDFENVAGLLSLKKGKFPSASNLMLFQLLIL
jgi:hypothetical protein